MEALSVIIATSQVRDGIRHSQAGPDAPTRRAPEPRRTIAAAAWRWVRTAVSRQPVGASARNRPADFRSDQSAAGTCA
ncbi:hypothetical protein ACFCV3_34495 [Kribbella sp. NPDC056345]|uniref:hypothetical protein n=1 Tax=Kribbella sp. NPDC056345 TaxID=3345789 RepID=UPI0035D9620D